MQEAGCVNFIIIEDAVDFFGPVRLVLLSQYVPLVLCITFYDYKTISLLWSLRITMDERPSSPTIFISVPDGKDTTKGYFNKKTKKNIILAWHANEGHL